MPEFVFFSEANARAKLLEGIKQTIGCRFLLNKNFADRTGNELIVLSSESLSWLDVNPRIYLIGDFVRNVEYNEMQSGEYDGTFVVNSLVGGPLIELSLPKETTRDGCPILLPWVLSLQPQFRETAAAATKQTPQEARSAYQEIVNFVKQGSHRVSVNKKTVYFFEAPFAEKRFRNQQIGLLMNGSIVHADLDGSTRRHGGSFGK